MKASMHGTGLRVTDDVLRRVDRLVKRTKNDPAMAAVGRVTRSALLRLAVARGLEVLERELLEKAV